MSIFDVISLEKYLDQSDGRKIGSKNTGTDNPAVKSRKKDLIFFVSHIWWIYHEHVVYPLGRACRNMLGVISGCLMEYVRPQRTLLFLSLGFNLIGLFLPALLIIEWDSQLWVLCVPVMLACLCVVREGMRRFASYISTACAYWASLLPGYSALAVIALFSLDMSYTMQCWIALAFFWEILLSIYGVFLVVEGLPDPVERY